MIRSTLCFAALVNALLLPFSSFAADANLLVKDPYVRLAPPNAPTTGAFMVIKNVGNADRELVKAESPMAKTAELHNHINDNGVMKMREVQSIDIKANSQAELKPGSYHIMLIDMKQALKEGDIVPITLTFDDGEKKSIEAPVRRIQTMMPADKNMDHQGMQH